MRNSAWRIPPIARADVSCLVTHRQPELAFQEQAELLVGMTVYLVDGSWRVDGPDEVHVFTRDDLPLHALVVPADSVEFIPGEDSPRCHLNTVFVHVCTVHGVPF